MQNKSGFRLVKFSQIYDHCFQDEEDEENKDVKKGRRGGKGEEKQEEKNEESNNTICSVQTFEYFADKFQLNPLLKQIIKRVISIDSQYRDKSIYGLRTIFTFDLSEPLRDVVSLKLYSIQILRCRMTS